MRKNVILHIRFSSKALGSPVRFSLKKGIHLGNASLSQCKRLEYYSKSNALFICYFELVPPFLSFKYTFKHSNKYSTISIGNLLGLSLLLLPVVQYGGVSSSDSCSQSSTCQISKKESLASSSALERHLTNKAALLFSFISHLKTSLCHIGCSDAVCSVWGIADNSSP